MGILDWINSTTDAVKRYSPPVPRPVQQACRTSYGYCYSAGGKIVDAVRSNSERASNYVGDQETRSQIGLFAYKLAQNSATYAFREGYKMLPGGKAFDEILVKTIRDVKSEGQFPDRKEPANVGGRKDSAGGGDRVNESPEDVLGIFMTTGFMGNRFVDKLLLPQIKCMMKNPREN